MHRQREAAGVCDILARRLCGGKTAIKRWMVMNFLSAAFSPRFVFCLPAEESLTMFVSNSLISLFSSLPMLNSPNRFSSVHPSICSPPPLQPAAAMAAAAAAACIAANGCQAAAFQLSCCLWIYFWGHFSSDSHLEETKLISR